MEHTENIGQRAVQKIHQHLMIDEPWTLRAERGFLWLGHRLLQAVEASPPFESREVLVSLISIRTLLVDDVTADPADVQLVLARLNVEAVGSAYVFKEAERTIELVACHNIHEETLEDRSADMASYAILQLIQGEMIAGDLAERVGGAAAVRVHPERGPRSDPDEMLFVAQKLFLPAGEQPSAFAIEEELEKVERWVKNSPLACMGASAETVCVEVPFGEENTTLIAIRTDEPHPWLGAGLTIRTTLPPQGSAEELARVADRLQQLQVQTVEGGGGFGAWSVRDRFDEPHVTWVRFVPNYVHRADRVLDVAMGEINRALWVDQLFHPGMPVRNAWEIMVKRLERTPPLTSPHGIVS